MSLRSISAASLLLCSLAWPLAAMAQGPALPNSEVNTAAINVQIAPPPIPISTAMLGLSGPLGAQSASGKPMFAEFLTVHHQSFTDGNRISHSTTSSIYRDTQGRIRRESQLSLPGMLSGASASTFITIVDHQLGYGYVLDPQEMVAHRYELNAAGPSYIARLRAQGTSSALLSPDPKQPAERDPNPPEASPWRQHAFSPRRGRPSPEAWVAPDAGSSGSSPVTSGTASHHLTSGFMVEDSGSVSPSNMRIDQPFLAAPNPVRTENLGEQTILGFRTSGTRVITTLPSGQIGNDRPIDIVSEQWFSSELELVMRSMHRDPWAGEFTTTVTRVSRGDQPASLFQIPAPYKVIEADSEGEHHVLDGHGNHSPGPAPW